eukprot:940464-Amphidinium_carterae.4
MFESKGDSTSTVLTMRWPVMGWCNATVVAAKGPVAWVVEWILRSLRSQSPVSLVSRNSALSLVNGLRAIHRKLSGLSPDGNVSFRQQECMPVSSTRITLEHWCSRKMASRPKALG